jgi:hypothetical protein
MTFTQKDLDLAVGRMALMDFFPQESKGALKVELAAMCPSLEALHWLTDTLVSGPGKWPGIAEVRGLLCTRFDAADGIDRPFCSIPGFTADEAEARYLARHENTKALEQAQARKLLRAPVQGKRSS